MNDDAKKYDDGDQRPDDAHVQDDNSRGVVAVDDNYSKIATEDDTVATQFQAENSVAPSQAAVYRNALASRDLTDLIVKSEAMADMLARIAMREETANPAVAARAGQAAARTYNEVIENVALNGRLNFLEEKAIQYGAIMREEARRGGYKGQSIEDMPDEMVPTWYREVYERRKKLAEEARANKAEDEGEELSEETKKRYNIRPATKPSSGLN